MCSYQLGELIFGSDCFCQVSCLMTHWTSQASVVQRRGRAGRCKPGLCFNLFSREQFERMGMFPHEYCSKATVVLLSVFTHMASRHAKLLKQKEEFS